VQVAPLQAAKLEQAKLVLQPMMELNLRPRRALAWPLPRLPEPCLGRPKEAQVARLAAGPGAKARGAAGGMLRVVLTTTLRRARPEQVAR